MLTYVERVPVWLTLLLDPSHGTLLSGGRNHTGRRVLPSAFAKKEAEAQRSKIVSPVHRR